MGEEKEKKEEKEKGGYVRWGERDPKLRVAFRTAGISGAVAKNKATNDEKAKFIRYGFIFLVLGIGMVIIFVLYLYGVF